MTGSEVANNALLLPVTESRGLRALPSAHFGRHIRRSGAACLPARRCLGKRALGLGAQGFRRVGRGGDRRIAGPVLLIFIGHTI